MAENFEEITLKAFNCFAQGLALLAAAGMPEAIGTGSMEPISFDEKAALARLSLGRTKFWDEIKTGKIPSPYKLGGCNHWDRKDLDAYVRNEKLNQQREAQDVERIRRKKR